MRKLFLLFLLTGWGLFSCCVGFAQNILESTKVKGFVHFETKYDVDNLKPSFVVGEQDFFITSKVGSHLTFLGESVIKYSSNKFSASMERMIFNYNYYRNHNILFGKHHTPLNYWNDTYHHGRLFFPTIDRPTLFSEGIIPIHTTGVSFQGQNLGKLKFGYDFMFGSGISSGDKGTNSNNSLSSTFSIHVKPIDGLRIGVSAYYDKIDETSYSVDHHNVVYSHEALFQQIYTVYLGYFGNKMEFISEFSNSINEGQTSGVNNTPNLYVYFGYPIENSSFIPYFRYDRLRYDEGEVYYNGVNKDKLIVGLRKEISFLTIIKLEYQVGSSAADDQTNVVKGQICIGF